MFRGGRETRSSSVGRSGDRGIARFRGRPLAGAAADGKSQFRGHFGAEGLSRAIKHGRDGQEVHADVFTVQGDRRRCRQTPIRQVQHTPRDTIHTRRSYEIERMQEADFSVERGRSLLVIYDVVPLITSRADTTYCINI